MNNLEAGDRYVALMTGQDPCLPSSSMGQTTQWSWYINSLRSDLFTYLVIYELDSLR